MKDKVYDYIIVGQGLAGTALAIHLLKKGRSLIIFNDPTLHSSSKAAAGIFNPITGRRWVTTWQAEEIFNYFPNFYKELEIKTGEQFFFERPVFRLFQNQQEQSDWVSKPRGEVSSFVNKITDPGYFQDFIDDDYGGILLNRSGYLNVVHYLASMKTYFEKLAILNENKVVMDEVRWESPFEINGYKANRLVLCAGYEGTKNTPFGEKPFRAVKGELLETDSGKIAPNVIFNGPVFILPQEDGTLKIGATYDFHDKSLKTTERARNQLIEKAQSFYKSAIEIRKQIAGIRPSSVDRRPVLGEHPQVANLSILNGLGTKGVSLAPYAAKLLVENLENGKELDREIDIKRFFK